MATTPTWARASSHADPSTGKKSLTISLRYSGHEFEQTLGNSEGQGSLAYCSPWGHKEIDTTE